MIGHPVRRRRLLLSVAALAALVGVRLGMARFLRTPEAPAEPVRRLSATFRDVGPRWSHDGRRVAFLRLYDSGHIALCVAPADLSRICMLTKPEMVNPDQAPSTGRHGFAAPDAPAWTPDDRGLTFPRGAWFTTRNGVRLPGNSLWAFDLDTGRARALFVQPVAHRRSGLCYRSPVWAADGEAAAAVALGPMDHTTVMETVGGRYRHEVSGALPEDGRDSDWPCWSPTGRRLAYAEGVLRGPHAARVAVLRMSELGGSVAGRVVTVTADAYRRMCPTDAARYRDRAIQPYITGLGWMGDGTELVYAVTPDANDLSRYSIWTVQARLGAQPERVSPDDGWGYMAPTALRSGLVGAVRLRNGLTEAVMLDPQRRGSADSVRRLQRLDSDEWDFRGDGRALVVSDAACSPGRRTTLRIVALP